MLEYQCKVEVQVPRELYYMDNDEKEYYRDIQGQKKIDWQKNNPRLCYVRLAIFGLVVLLIGCIVAIISIM